MATIEKQQEIYDDYVRELNSLQGASLDAIEATLTRLIREGRHYSVECEPLMLEMDAMIEALVRQIATSAIANPIHLEFLSLAWRLQHQEAAEAVRVWQLTLTALDKREFREGWKYLTWMRFAQPDDFRHTLFMPAGANRLPLSTEERDRLADFMFRPWDWLTTGLADEAHVNLLKSWAQAYRVWDFSLSHPMLSLNSSTALTLLLQGRRKDELPTLDFLDQCLKSAAFDRSKTLVQLDALIAVTAQARKWSTNRERLVYITASDSHKFFTWIQQPAGERGNNIDRVSLSSLFLSRFFQGITPPAASSLLVVMPFYSPGHHTLVAFFWTDAKTLTPCYFNSMWSTQVRSEHDLLFIDTMNKLQKLWNIRMNKTITFDQTLLQHSAECAAIVLYGMDLLCANNDKEMPLQRIRRLTPIIEGKGLSEAARMWVSKTLHPQWKYQMKLLYSLDATKVMKSDIFPLLEQWQTLVIETSHQLRQHPEDSSFFDVIRVLRCNEIIAAQDWTRAFDQPFILGVDKATVLRRYREGDLTLQEAIPPMPWNPDVRLIVALLSLPEDETRKGFLKAWFVHHLFFPQWPLDEGEVKKHARDFWVAAATLEGSIDYLVEALLSLTKRQENKLRALVVLSATPETELGQLWRTCMSRLVAMETKRLVKETEDLRQLTEKCKQSLDEGISSLQENHDELYGFVTESLELLSEVEEMKEALPSFAPDYDSFVEAKDSFDKAVEVANGTLDDMTKRIQKISKAVAVREAAEKAARAAAAREAEKMNKQLAEFPASIRPMMLLVKSDGTPDLVPVDIADFERALEIARQNPKFKPFYDYLMRWRQRYDVAESDELVVYNQAFNFITDALGKWPTLKVAVALSAYIKNRDPSSPFVRWIRYEDDVRETTPLDASSFPSVEAIMKDLEKLERSKDEYAKRLAYFENQEEWKWFRGKLGVSNQKNAKEVNTKFQHLIASLELLSASLYKDRIRIEKPADFGVSFISTSPPPPLDDTAAYFKLLGDMTHFYFESFSKPVESADENIDVGWQKYYFPKMTPELGGFLEHPTYKGMFNLPHLARLYADALIALAPRRKEAITANGIAAAKFPHYQALIAEAQTSYSVFKDRLNGLTTPATAIQAKANAYLAEMTNYATEMALAAPVVKEELVLDRATNTRITLQYHSLTPVAIEKLQALAATVNAKMSEFAHSYAQLSDTEATFWAHFGQSLSHDLTTLRTRAKDAFQEFVDLFFPHGIATAASGQVSLLQIETLIVPSLPLLVEPASFDITYAKYNELFQLGSVSPVTTVDMQKVHADVTAEAVAGVDRADKIPFLMPVDMARWQRLLDWTNVENYQRRLAALSIEALETRDAVVDTDAANLLIKKKAADYGGDDVSYVLDAQRDALKKRIREAQQYVHQFNKNVEARLNTDETKLAQIEASWRLVLADPVQVTLVTLPNDIPPLLADQGMDKANARIVEAAKRFMPDPQSTPQAVLTARKDAYLRRRTKLERDVAAAEHAQVLHEGPLRATLDQHLSDAFAAALKVKADELGRPTQQNLAAYEHEVASLRKRLQEAKDTLRAEYGGKTFRGSGNLFSEVAAALHRADNVLHDFERTLEVPRFSQSHATTSTSIMMPSHADYFYRPEYEDEGGPDRPPWLLLPPEMNEDTAFLNPGAWKTYHMFGCKLPTDADRLRAVTRFNKYYRAKIREQEAEARNEFAAFTREQRQIRRELLLLTTKY